MNENNSNAMSQDVVEISLSRFLKKMLLMWRAVLLAAIAFALLLAGAKYVLDARAYRASSSAVNTDKKVDPESLDLTEEEKAEVENAADKKQQYEFLTSYMENSIKMNLDPMDISQLTLLYEIRAGSGTDSSNLVVLYASMLSSEESVKAIGEAGGIDADPEYIRELLSAYDGRSVDQRIVVGNSSDAILKVTFYLPKDVSSDSVEGAIDSLVSLYHPEGSGITSEGAQKLSSSVNSIVDTGLQTTQWNYANNLSTYKTNYDSAVSSFSDDQNTLLDSLLEERGIATPEEEKGETAEAPHFSGKYAAVGAIIGILLFFFAELLSEIFRKKWSSVASAGSFVRLGTLFDRDARKKNFLMRDRLLEKGLYRKEANLERSALKAVAEAEVHSSYEKMKEFELWLVGFEKNHMTELILESAAGKGISVTVRTTADDRPEEMIPFTASGKSVVLAVKEGESRKKDAAFLARMLRGKEADFPGVIEFM